MPGSTPALAAAEAMRDGVKDAVLQLAETSDSFSDIETIALICAGAFARVVAPEPESTRAVLSAVLDDRRATALADFLLDAIRPSRNENGGERGPTYVESALAPRFEALLAPDAEPFAQQRSELARVLTAIDAVALASEAAAGLGQEPLRARIEAGLAEVADAELHHRSPALRRRLDDDANDWRAADADPSFLYQGAQLARVEDHRWRIWREHADGFAPLNPVELDFLDHARNAEARRGRFRRVATRSAAALLVIVLIGSTIALASHLRLLQQRDELLSQDIAAASLAAGETDGDLARRLAATAWELAPTLEAEAALLQALDNPRAGSLASIPEGARELVYSPDGRFLVTVGDNGYVAVRDAATGELLDVLPFDASSIASGSALAFDRDSRVLAVFGFESVGFWDLKAREEAMPPIGLYSQDFERMAMSPDADAIALSSFDEKEVVVVDTVTQQRLGVFESPDTVSALAFSPSSDGVYIGVDSAEEGVETLRVVDYTGTELDAWSYSSPPAAFTASPDGKLVAVTLTSGNTLLVPTEGEPAPPRILTGLNLPLAFLPDGETIMGATGDGMAVGVWDTDSERQIGTLPLTECSGLTCPFAISQNGESIVTANGGSLLSLDPDLMQWSYSSPIAWLDTEYDSFATGAVAPDGGGVVAGNGGGVFHWATGPDGMIDPVGAAPDRLSEVPTTLIEASPDGTVIAAAASEGPENVDVTVIDLKQPSEPITLATGGLTSAMAFDPTGSRLAVAVVIENGFTATRQVEFWDTETWTRATTEPIPTGELATRSLCFAPGDLLLVGNDEAVEAVDLASGESAARLELGTSAYSITCGTEGEAMLHTHSHLIRWGYPAESLETIVATDALDYDHGGAFAMSPDGKYVATADYLNQTVRLWDAENGTLIRTFAGYETGNDLAFSPDGKTLVGFGSQLHVWDLDFVSDPYAAVCDLIEGPPSASDWAEYAPDLDHGEVAICD